MKKRKDIKVDQKDWEILIQLKRELKIPISKIIKMFIQFYLFREKNYLNKKKARIIGITKK